MGAVGYLSPFLCLTMPRAAADVHTNTLPETDLPILSRTPFRQ
jgi:hypothetical protein